jgi:hypothetical protein
MLHSLQAALIAVHVIMLFAGANLAEIPAPQCDSCASQQQFHGPFSPPYLQQRGNPGKHSKHPW